MRRLLCTADWHIGAGSEYGRRPGDRLKDQRDVALQIADLAIEEAVDGVLIAGDLLEGPAMLPEHLEVVTAFIDRLQGRIPVLACSGNGKHDLSMRSTNGLAIFNHIDGIRVSSTPDVYPFAGCAVATLPWVSPARLVAARGGGDRDEVNADAAQLLVEIASRGREDCDRVAPGAPAILLGHWSVSGSSLPNGLPVDQLREPVIPIDDLEALGFDAIALGHIHQPQMIGAGLLPLADPNATGVYDEAGSFYVGSPMPLNFGEAHTAHGVWILDIPGGSSSSVRDRSRADGQSNGIPADDPATPGSRSTFHPIGSRRFLTVDLGTDADVEWALGHAVSVLGTDDVAGSELLEDAIVRVRFTATREQMQRINVPELRATIGQVAALVKIEPTIVREDRARVEGFDEGVGELDALEQWMLAQGIVGVDEPLELAEPTRLLAEAMRTRTRGYLEAAA